MKHLILILLTTLCCTYCNVQRDKEATTMKTAERFDVRYYKSIIKEKNSYEGATSAQYIERNGTETYVSFNEDGFVLQEIKPFTYEMIVKNYYKNCILKSKGKLLCHSSVKIDIWREYDDQGNLIKKTDKDKKFEKLRLKPINILRWLEHEGYIDRKAGKDQERFVRKGDAPGISISFDKISAPNAKFGKDSVLWTITITDRGGDLTYTWNAKNGELLSKEILQAIE